MTLLGNALLSRLWESHRYRILPFPGGHIIRTVDSGIVGQLTGLGDTDIERLSVAVCAGASRPFENVSPMTGERHQRGPRPSDDVRNGLHEAELAKRTRHAGRRRPVRMPSRCGHLLCGANRRGHRAPPEDAACNLHDDLHLPDALTARALRSSARKTLVTEPARGERPTRGPVPLRVPPGQMPSRGYYGCDGPIDGRGPVEGAWRS